MDAVKRIALSFDDAPNSDDPYFSDSVRTSALIEALAAAGVEQAIVFGVGNKLDDPGRARLRQYGTAGHVIGNHTFDHCNAATADASAFLDSLRRADGMLRALPNFKPYFRFPFLSEGDTRQKRDAIRRGAGDLGYREAYVTVPTIDWYLQEGLFRARGASKLIHMEPLRELYMQMIAETAAFYHELAIRALGRSPAHVLLLQENDAAALFVRDLVQRLRGDGWQVIRASDAYADPLSADEPQTLVSGNGRVAALARDRGCAGPLQSPWEDRSVLQREIERRGVW